MDRLLKAALAKKIFDQIRFDELVETSSDFKEITVTAVSPLVMQLRIKTWTHGTEYVNVRIQSMI